MTLYGSKRCDMCISSGLRLLEPDQRRKVIQSLLEALPAREPCDVALYTFFEYGELEKLVTDVRQHGRMRFQ